MANPLTLGYNPFTKAPVTVEDKDRYASTYVLGNTGTGKSGFLKTQIHQDITMGNAVIVIDPHGDLANDCMAALPAGSVARTYVLDMEDEAYPFGLNIFAEAGTFETEVERGQAVERILHIFDVLWEDVLKQQNLPMLLRYATMTFLDNPGSTLVDMIRFFRDDVFRAKMLARVSDPTIREFFANEFDSMTPKDRANRVAPLMNRLQSLFVGRSLIRNILGQRKSSIDFRKAIENHETIFIKLPTTAMKEDAKLVGMFIMAEITAAIFSFRDTPAHLRPGVSLYVDEFQNFTTEDFDKIITEARKFGVRLTIAHQYRDQLPGYLKASTTTVRTKICFRVSAADGKEMAQYFPDEAEDDIEISTNATKHLLDNGTNDRYADELIEAYLRPIQDLGGKWIEITDDGWSATKVFTLVSPMPTPKKPQKIKAHNPLPYLDDLFRKVMETGNPHLDIPVDAVLGFSNLYYHGFYQQAKRGGWELTSSVTFPLVVATPTGPEWVRSPQDGHEQFLHLIFLIRMTMVYLAEHPVGKTMTAKAADIAKFLTQLPNRAAFVRSGDSPDQIYTLDMPPELTGDALFTRMELIKHQSRAKYAHPRDRLNEEPNIGETAVRATMEHNQATGLSWFGDTP